MKLALITFLAGLALAGVVQQWRMDAQVAQMERAHQVQTSEREVQLRDQQVEQIRHVLKAERSQRVQVDQALAAARGREVAMRRDVLAVQSERDRLRDAAADAVRMSSASHEACIDRASALREVFDQCTARYGELAQAADRHVSDLQTLSEAWQSTAPRSASPASAPKE